MMFLQRVAVVYRDDAAAAACIKLYFCKIRLSAANSAIVLKPPLLSQQVDYNEFEDSINVTVPSTNAGMVHENC